MTWPAEELYLDLLKKCLTRIIFEHEYWPLNPDKLIDRLLYAPVRKLLSLSALELVRRISIDPEVRGAGRDWPGTAETMIGLRRLSNIQSCIRDVLRHDVPGDLIETGVWRGGASIFMRGVLKAYGDDERTVWVADSFRGLPKPNERLYPVDAGDELWRAQSLAVPLEEVKANFARYGLLDEQVRFLIGWFSDTLPTAPIDKLAILRLDGDLYESTIVALRSLYPKLSVGGFVIVDDYALTGCRAAVDDYRSKHGISDELIPIDSDALFWQKR